ncbi:PREDICTED: uncharacterized protein LOC106805226 isoform X2 [Priapulus caudatus]|uniref:Uncharacterized protein LOC106805226 isoform X2 n=1 Tax=Priapulus caudatus TaxID=37621 RepID=A0ABM1DQK3_PRICU|nr:PREDICTED: uncharacterized protein LOC106805226 isoform X2 [Priapulus caudatus]
MPSLGEDALLYDDDDGVTESESVDTGDDVPASVDPSLLEECAIARTDLEAEMPNHVSPSADIAEDFALQSEHMELADEIAEPPVFHRRHKMAETTNPRMRDKVGRADLE